MQKAMNLMVNGKAARVEVDGERSLLSVLRDDLNLTGAKYGCGEGQCGACTVIIDGAAVRSCITSVGSVGSRPITTIEGLEKDGKLHPVQEAFLEADAMQCAYCTSGMILAAVNFLKKNSDPTVEDIARGMNGNICRCGCYQRIVHAITIAARKLRQK
jgi:aerobic-type carbon monoxide dehydrogenase small subunit (CoxS/CutS family)